MIRKVEAGLLNGNVFVPASKSDAQRAILAASLSKGKSKVYNTGTSKDVEAMLSCAEVVGAEVVVSSDFIEIEGVSSFPKKGSFDCGESGLAFRLIAALCLVNNGIYELNGQGTLLERNHDFIDVFGKEYGIRIESSKGKLPYTIYGGLNAKSIRLDGKETSQFLSGMLMALPLVGNEVCIEALNVTSTPYLHMTVNTLKAFGVDVYFDEKSLFTIPAGSKYRPTEYYIEGDWSAASYWIVAAALGHDVTIKGLSQTSMQADKMILQLLDSIGVIYSFESGALLLEKSMLTSFNFDATDCPDLFPALVSLAAFSHGTSRISGVHRLLNKESNRAESLKKEFEKMGAEIHIEGNALVVHGKSLHSSEVRSHGDHRIAMCLAIAGLNVEGGIAIAHSGAVAKSYPSFWHDFEKLHTKKMGH